VSNFLGSLHYPIALHCSEIDTEAILNKTRQLLIDDKLRETMKATQRKAFEEHFSWRQFQSKIVHAVESCFS
jgi:glycosyltransferase involved in cell wall biosynthesis